MRRWSVLAALLLLSPLLAVRAGRLVHDVPKAAQALLTQSHDERRLAVYGDCGGAGYGYIRRVLADAPDPALRPRVRYPDYDRFGNVVLPWARLREDPRVLIGVELTDADLQSRRIEARPIEGRDERSSWAVRTRRDFDVFEGARVTLAAPAASARTLSITLFDRPERTIRLGRWTVAVTTGQTAVDVIATPPLQPFSISRSEMDFLIDVDGAVVNAVSVSARIVDLTPFEVIHRSGSCFTAVARELGVDAEWSEWRSRLAARP